MANQNPQPEIYTTRHTFGGSATQGSSDLQTVYTNQASNEEVLLNPRSRSAKLRIARRID